MRQGNDRDSDFGQDTSTPGQSVQRWKLRMMAQSAALREIANSESRWLLDRNKSLDCADANAGGSVIPY